MSRPGIDPLDTLAFTLYSNQGVYAVLVGSGLSTSAGIMTGYQISVDLASRVARSIGEDPASDPVAWFAAKYDIDPGYSDLLEALAPTAAERQGILRPYIEPRSEDREQGRKVPTPAHRAIAALVSSSVVRVVITTNFDPLIEIALQDAGVTPVVLSTEDQVTGMTPLEHALPGLVIKPNGTFTDALVRNTADELARYGPAMTELLGRIFDEYGLLVVGWSATYDPALAAAITRSPTRRYGTFWLRRGPLTAEATALVVHRAGIELETTDANQFFGRLVDRVVSLRAIEAGHPLSPTMAVATIKRRLLDPTARIQVVDLVREAAEVVVDALVNRPVRLLAELNVDDVRTELPWIEERLATLAPLLATGAGYDQGAHALLWPQIINRVTNAVPTVGARPGHWDGLIRYPGTLLMYAGGVAALGQVNGVSLRELLTGTVARVGTRERSGRFELASGQVISRDRIDPMFGSGVLWLSARVERVTQRWMRDVQPDPVEYLRCFYRFEHLLGVLEADALRGEATLEQARAQVFLPGGRFLYERWPGGQRDALEVLTEDLANPTPSRAALLLPLFDDDPRRLESANLLAVAAYDALRERWM